MEFPDDSNDSLMLSAVESYETQANKVDESVRFETEEIHADDDQPDDIYLVALKARFGHNNFRPLQWKIIKSILVEKRDTCAIMTTGYGKSLCYQFPSVYTAGVTVVISPLISLMEDQVLSLSVLNIKAAFLGSAQKEKIYDNIVMGEYRVVYLTPEYVTGPAGLNLLEKLSEQLTLVAIDEAHCVSSWGHDFRSAFRALSIIRTIVPKVPMMALTATATKSVLDDIVQVLQLRNPHKLCSGFDRPNLKLVVRTKFNQWTDLQKILRTHQDGSIIIYCLKRQDTENLVKLLQGHGVDCAAYHAGLPMKTRRSVHENFVRDKLKLIVATVAFGMGIDKPDVRCVINYGASREIESYYQEIGRAGRDGQQATVVTFYSRGDFEFHTHMRQLAKNKLHQNHMHALNLKFQQYLESSGCRRKFILTYFGDPKADSLTIRPNCCDNCDTMLVNKESPLEYEELNSEGLYDFGPDTRLLINAIKACSHYGITMPIMLLRGSHAKKMPNHLLRHALHGKGSHKADTWWRAVSDILNQNGYIQISTMRIEGAGPFAKRTQVSVTVEGQRWLIGGEDKPLWIKPKREMLAFFRVKRKDVEKNMIPLEELRKKPMAKLLMNANEGSSATAEDLMKEREKTYEEEFRKRLFSFRLELANSMDVMPYMIVSEKCLQQMVDKPPVDIDSLDNYDGLSESKIALFGTRFIQFIKQTVEDMKITYPEYVSKDKRIDVPSEVKMEVEHEALQRISKDQPSTSKQAKVVSANENSSTAMNATFLDDDDEEIFLLEQAVLRHEAESESPPAEAQPPPAKRKLLSVPSVTALKYGSDSDGDDIIASIPSTQQRAGPSWLSARTSQSSSQEKKKLRSIKSIW